jgi:hypothetical protein
MRLVGYQTIPASLAFPYRTKLSRTGVGVEKLLPAKFAKIKLRQDALPHCPVDRIVLNAGGIDGVWTKCDSAKEYMEWINALRKKARPLSLAEWEHQIWLRGVGRKQWLRSSRMSRLS